MVLASRMHEIHALLSLDKPGGEYYMGGQSLLPTELASSSSAISNIFWPSGGRGQGIMPIQPYPTGGLFTT